MTGASARHFSFERVATITAARAYIFFVLYFFFLKTDLREESDIFLFQREGQSREDREAEIERSFWERLGPFDGQFYLDIAHNGYRKISSSSRQGELGNYAFFPLLPSTLAAFRAASPRFYIPLTIATAFAAGIAGTLALSKLAEKLGVSPILTVGALLCFPSAPYQFVLYSEGIALGLSGLALVYILKRKPWPALAFGLLAGLSRPQGILLAIPAFVELVFPSFQESRPGGRAPVAGWLATLAPLAGFGVMAIVSHIASGSPTAFLSVQSKWGRSFEAGGFLKALVSVFAYGGPPLDLLGLLLGLGLLPLMWKRLPPSLFLYGAAAVLMPLLTGSIPLPRAVHVRVAPAHAGPRDLP